MLVVVFAALMAAHTIHSLVGTQIEGVTGTNQDTESKERRWDFATQWSLPKMETARLVTPGLYGYRWPKTSPSATNPPVIGEGSARTRKSPN